MFAHMNFLVECIRLPMQMGRAICSNLQVIAHGVRQTSASAWTRITDIRPVFGVNQFGLGFNENLCKLPATVCGAQITQNFRLAICCLFCSEMSREIKASAATTIFLEWRRGGKPPLTNSTIRSIACSRRRTNVIIKISGCMKVQSV